MRGPEVVARHFSSEALVERYLAVQRTLIPERNGEIPASSWALTSG